MKPASNAQTPQEYINGLSEPRKSDIIALDAFIRKTAPTLTPYMQSGMLAYGPYHYTYASGREGDWCVVGLSSRAQYISLYICATDGKKYLPEEYAQQLPKANIGKSCIRFKALKDIDTAVLGEMLVQAEAWAKAQKS